MSRMKIIFNSIVFGVMLFSAISYASAVSEGEEYLKLGSKEEAISASQNEDGGEDIGVVTGVVDDSLKKLEEEDPDPIPTLENATKQEIEPSEISEEDASGGVVTEEIPQQDNAAFDFQENMPYMIIIILAIVSIVGLFVFALKKNMKRK